MTISKVNGAGWGVGEKLTSAQANSFDTKIITALDKTAAGDTLAGAITATNAGRIVPTVTLGPDANTSFTVGAANSVIRVTSAVTTDRNYTLLATSAITNDVITIYCESSFASPAKITIKDQASATIYVLGNGDNVNGQWCSFIYIGGWRVFQQSQGSKLRTQTFITGGTFTVPVGVTRLTLVGCGGGGGGGGATIGNTASSATGGRGGGGGGGAMMVTYSVVVTPAEAATVSVAAGGVGGTVTSGVGAPGGDGGTTAFACVDGTYNFYGAAGGRGGTYCADAAGITYASGGSSMGGAYQPVFAPAAIPPAYNPDDFRRPAGYGGVGWGYHDTTPSTGLDTAGMQNGSCAGGAGGAKGTDGGGAAGGGGGGGGGGGPFPGSTGGAGGNGGNSNIAGAGNAGTAGAPPAGGSYGAGGGGGGGSGRGAAADNPTPVAGGAGAPGKLIVMWVS